MSPSEVEQMMFLRLNQNSLPEGRQLHEVDKKSRDETQALKTEVQGIQERAAGQTIDVTWGKE